MDASREILEIFLSIVREPSASITVPWYDLAAAIQIARQYDCPEVARKLLYTGCQYDLGPYRLEALAEACQLSHHLAAWRILRNGNHGERGMKNCISLRPNSGAWTTRQAASLSPAWTWALTCAVQEVDRKRKIAGQAGSERISEDYWIAVCGEFMTFLSKCESIPSRRVSLSTIGLIQ